MIEYLTKPKDPKRFGGSIGAKEAQLDNHIVDELRLRAPLNRFAKQLMGQYKGLGRKPDRYNEGARVIGVQLHSINFTLVTEPIPKER